MKMKKKIILITIIIVIIAIFSSLRLLGANSPADFVKKTYPANRWDGTELYNYKGWGRYSADYSNLGVFYDKLWNDYLKNKGKKVDENFIHYWEDESNEEYSEWLNVYNAYNQIYTNWSKFTDSDNTENLDELNGMVRNLVDALYNLTLKREDAKPYYNELNTIYQGYTQNENKTSLINGRDVAVITSGENAVYAAARNSCDGRVPSTYDKKEGYGDNIFANFYAKIGEKTYYCKTDNELNLKDVKPISVNVGEKITFYDNSTKGGYSGKIIYDFQIHKSNDWINDNYTLANNKISTNLATTDTLGQGKEIGSWTPSDNDTGEYVFYLQIDPKDVIKNGKDWTGYGSINGNYAVASGPNARTECNWIGYFVTLKVNVVKEKTINVKHVLVDNDGNKTIVDAESFSKKENYPYTNNTASYDRDGKNYIKIMRSYILDGEYNESIVGRNSAKEGTYKFEGINGEDVKNQTINIGSYTSDTITVVYEYRCPWVKIHFLSCAEEHGNAYDATRSATSVDCANYKWSTNILEGPYTYGYDAVNDIFKTDGFSVKQNGDGEKLYQPTSIWPSGKTYNLVNSYLAYENNDERKDHISIALNSSITKTNLNYSQDGGEREYIARNPGKLGKDLNVVGEYKENEWANSHPITVKYVKDKDVHSGYSSSCLNESSSLIKEVVVRVPDGQNASINLEKEFTYGEKQYALSNSYINYSSTNKGQYHTSNTTTTRNLGTISTNTVVIIAECHEKKVEKKFNVRTTSYTMSDMNNDSRGVILDSDGEYNTYRGIPSGDNIKAEIKADDYMYNLKGTKYTGDANYEVTVPVTYRFSWGAYCSGRNCRCNGHIKTGTKEVSDGKGGTKTVSYTYTEYCSGCTCPGNHSHSVSVTKNYKFTINRKFEYYTINSFNIYQMKNGWLSNPLLDSNLTWTGKNITINKWIGGDPFEDHINFHAGNAFGLTGSLQTTTQRNSIAATTNGDKITTKTYSESYSLGNGYSYGWQYSTGNNGDESSDANGYCKKSKYSSTADSAVDPIEVRNDYLRVNINGGSPSREIIVGATGSSYNDSAPSLQKAKDTTPNYSKQVDSEIYKSKTSSFAKTTSNDKYTTTSNIDYRLKFTESGEQDIRVSSSETNSLKGYREISRTANYINIENEYTTANKVNDVAVHTPVYVRITGITTDEDTKINNQRYNNNPDNTVVLDKNFIVNFTYTGDHRPIQGFGSNNYYEFVKDVYIKFPFDVYIKPNNNANSTSAFLSANTWYKLNSTQKSEGKIYVTVPVWAYDTIYSNSSGIMMAVTAINDHGNEIAGTSFENTNNERGGYREGNNDRVENSSRSTVDSSVEYLPEAYYSRTYSYFTIELAGRVYDFTFTYTDDSNYANEFKTGIFRDRMINNLPYPQKGDNITNTYATALRLGSKIRFDLKTKGKASANVQVVPTFYWVSKQGGTLQKVDAYYLDNGKRTKLTTSNGITENITVQNVTEVPNTNNYRLLTNEIGYTKVIGRVGNGYSYAGNTTIGKTGRIWLGTTERLAYDIITGNDAYAKNYGSNQTESSVKANAGGINNILASNSHWYGEFTLPENTWFTKEGENPNKAIDQEGYVIVYFNIVTKKDGDSNTYLSYQYPTSNTQWQKEGWVANKTITLPNGKTTTDLGTSTGYVSIAIYDANINKNGSRVVVTH